MVRGIGKDWENGETLDDEALTRLDGEEDMEKLGTLRDLG